VALSYCWGGDQKIKLETRHILDGKPWHLPEDLLPQTILDAVVTTRNLGIEYLWIDALCIIQDDDQDKAKEIGSMGSIYKNATLTISVAGSDSVTKSFLGPRLLSTAAWLPFLQPDGTLEELGIVDQGANWSEEEPLEKRMWTLQETWLSPCLLSCQEQDITWRCHNVREFLLLPKLTDEGTFFKNVGPLLIEVCISDPSTDNYVRPEPGTSKMPQEFEMKKEGKGKAKDKGTESQTPQKPENGAWHDSG
jgi:hypothetical protein